MGGARLASLVDVVVLVGVDMSTEVGGRSLGLSHLLLVVVLGTLLVELGLVLREHVLLVLSDDGRGGRLDVLGGEGLVVLDGLDSVLMLASFVAQTTTTRGSLGGGGCVALGRQPRRSRHAPWVGRAPG